MVGELGGSALFGARFRENAGRALLIPRAYPGPPHAAVAAAAEVADAARGRAPLRAVPDRARDLPRVPARRARPARPARPAAQAAPRASCRWSRSRRRPPSPFASSLLFDYVATYMYEGDQPNAERRAAALALDRELLRELLGQEELRELIDPGALEHGRGRPAAAVASARAADSVDALHDVLRRVGDLTRGRGACRAAARRSAWLEQLRGERRAIELRVGGEQRWVAAEDAGLYRDALGAVPPSGLPEAFIADVPDAMERLVRRYARTHGPFETRALRDRYGLDLDAGAGAARAAPATSCAASCGPAARSASGATPRCCGGCGARRWPRCGRRSSPPTSARFARFQAVLAGRRPPPAGRRGRRPPARGAGAAAGPGAAARGVGARRAAAPRRRLLAGVDGPAVRVRRDRVGRRRRARPPLRPRRALLPRRRAAARPAAARAASRRRSRCTSAMRERLRAGAVLLHRPADRRRRLHDRGAAERRSGTSCGRARRPTTRSRRCARRS